MQCLSGSCIEGIQFASTGGTRNSFVHHRWCSSKMCAVRRWEKDERRDERGGASKAHARFAYQLRWLIAWRNIGSEQGLPINRGGQGRSFTVDCVGRQIKDNKQDCCGGCRVQGAGCEV